MHHSLHMGVIFLDHIGHALFYTPSFNNNSKQIAVCGSVIK